MKPRKPRLWVKTFQPRFYGGVEAGTKRNTIRPRPQNGILPKPGDRISCRAWLGKPYRSKQRVLREGTIVAVIRVTIRRKGVDFGAMKWRDDSTKAVVDQLHAFAVRDGFEDWPEMRAWFSATHGLPFKGILIAWLPDEQ